MYPQLMDITLLGKIDIETTWKYGTGGESYRFTPGNDSWLIVSLKEIPEGDYKLFCDIVKDPTDVSFTLEAAKTRFLNGYQRTVTQKKDYQTSLSFVILLLKNSKDDNLRFRTERLKNSLLLNTVTLMTIKPMKSYEQKL